MIRVSYTYNTMTKPSWTGKSRTSQWILGKEVTRSLSVLSTVSKLTLISHLFRDVHTLTVSSTLFEHSSIDCTRDVDSRAVSMKQTIRFRIANTVGELCGICHGFELTLIVSSVRECELAFSPGYLLKVFCRNIRRYIRVIHKHDDVHP